MKRKRAVPVSKIGSTIVSADLIVETDETGRYWLSPGQVRQLKQMRSAISGLQASNQPLPGGRLVIKSRRTSHAKAAIATTGSSVVAAFTQIMRGNAVNA